MRYAHRGQCQICGSDIVVEAEWPLDERGAMALPESRLHGLAAAFAVLASVGAVALAWGESSLWGVVPCAVVTVALVFIPVRQWPRKEVGDELGAMARQTTFDGHAMQEGAAREIAAVTSSAAAGGVRRSVFRRAAAAGDDPAREAGHDRRRPAGQRRFRGGLDPPNPP